MKAFILIAGEGTRLRPLTEERPKPMLPVANKPVLQHIIEHLASSGVTQIMMNPGYKGEMVEHYFGDGGQYGVSISYFPEMVETQSGFSARPKGSASSLAFVEHFYEFFDEPVLVLCGDALIDLDVAKAMEQHIQSSAFVSVLLQEIDSSIAHKYGIAQVNDDGVIGGFTEKPKVVETPNCMANTGVYIFSPQAVKEIPLTEGVDIGGHLLPRWVAEKRRIVGLNLPYQWLDIGTVKDFKRVNHLMHRQISSRRESQDVFSWENKVDIGFCCRSETPITRVKGSLLIGNGCLIKENVNILRDVIIGNNCVIGENCILENSIVGDYCYLPPGTKLINSILTNNYLITFDWLGNVKRSIQLNSASSRPFFQSTLKIESLTMSA